MATEQPDEILKLLQPLVNYPKSNRSKSVRLELKG